MAAPAAPTLLDVAARVPAAAALIAAALSTDERKALRLAHPALREAVAEVVAKLVATFEAPSDGGAPPARPPTARRWRGLRALELPGPELPIDCLRALGAEPWSALEELDIRSCPANFPAGARDFGVPAARALAAAAPALRALKLLALFGLVPPAALEEVLRVEWPALEQLVVIYLVGLLGQDGGAAPPARTLQPRLRHAVLIDPDDAASPPAPGDWLAARGWPLEELRVGFSDAAGLAALAAAPTLALRVLELWGRVDDAGARHLAEAPWPLEELDIVGGEFYAEGRLALAGLARHARLRRLDLERQSAAGEDGWLVGWLVRELVCYVAMQLYILELGGASAAAVRALLRAAWPELVDLSVYAVGENAGFDDADSDEDETPGKAAFALCPKLEVMHLWRMPVRAAGARALASRRWPRLRELLLIEAGLDDDALAALARGAWPALVRLDLRLNPGIRAPPALGDVQRWAPAVTNFHI